MKIVNEQDRLCLWAVSANGTAQQITKATKLDFNTVRAVVSANSPADALNAANGEAFKIGVRNATADEPAEIAIYGEIGDPWMASDAASVGQFLRANKGQAVNVRINSPGGLAYDGICIHNALLNHDGPVTTTIEGLAGSAASIIAMGGKPAKIYENAQLFIHRAALVAIGNRDAMEEAMRWLDTIDEAIARTYKAKTGKALDKILDLMKGPVDGTVFSARDAVAEKFCNEVIPLKKNAGTNSTRSTPTAFVNTDGSVEQFDQTWAPGCGLNRSVEVARAIRMRTRNEYFVPSNSVVNPIRNGKAKPDNCSCEYPDVVLRNGSGHSINCQCHKEWEAAGGFRPKQKPKASGGPMYDVGDRVKVTEEGVEPFEGEVRSSCLAYSYCVMDDSGTMHDDCCEEEMAMVGEDE